MRVQKAHGSSLFISVLAYHLLAATDEAEQVHHIRVCGKPEAVPRDIYKQLQIADPIKRNHRIVVRRL